ncbi:papain-like cysteine protease family protein [Paraburkholderia caledonica]|uniref:papain-like cysteine protease family protein n=1 Tax=Paraburkholderia caledonica TaxID=134536 RepID=UPI000B3FA5ED|nr:papain-like cysteine protease family protein [Paraburkholderia caledonica]
MFNQIPQIDLPHQPPGPEPFRTVPISIEHQLQSEWCWAAVAVAINALLPRSPGMTQCTIASQMTGGDCCNDGESDICNQPKDLADVLHLMGFDVQIGDVKSVEELADRIARKCAVAVRVSWPDGSGHFLLVTGVEDVQNLTEIKDILIADPIYGSGVCSYQDLQTDYLKQGGIWSNTYFPE